MVAEPGVDSMISAEPAGEVIVMVDAGLVRLIKLPGPSTRSAVSMVIATAGCATVPAA